MPDTVEKGAGPKDPPPYGIICSRGSYIKITIDDINLTYINAPLVENNDWLYFICNNLKSLLNHVNGVDLKNWSFVFCKILILE